jgi:hypothetical protein
MKLTLLSLPALALASPMLKGRQSTATLLSMTGTGDGCPPGAFSTQIDTQATAAKASFDNFILQAGLDVPVLSQNLGCDISVVISFPGSCTQAVLRTQTDAFVLVAEDAGATATLSTPFELTGGSVSGSPRDLTYNSVPDDNSVIDIANLYNVTVSATGTTATFVAHLSIFLNAPNATLISKIALDGFGFLISQDGLC